VWNESRCTVVLPVRNEVRNLSRLVSTIPAFIDEIIVVDGNSSDGSFELAQQLGPVSTVLRQTHKGKGAALSLGFSISTGDYVFVMDTDGSMNPRELQLFAEALDSGASAAKGSRNSIGGGSDDITRFRNAGNDFLTWMTNYLYRASLSDITYGYWGLRRETLLDLGLMFFDSKDPRIFSHRAMTYGQGFEIEALMLCRILRAQRTLVEIPCWENERWSGSSNLHAISDGLRTLRAILRERFRRNW
jgi:glycosyltransferase involved in cell wall biosynthesis